MKKILFLTASAIAMLASCSQNDLEAPVVAEAQQSAVEFGTYLGKAAESRATVGTQGTMTTATMATSGFGVFAYYTGSDTYGQYQHTTYAGETGGTSDADHYANFMYNQQVTSAESPYTTWTYTPLKYWPNEFVNGAVDAQSPAATGTAAVGKVSFFAYAPYVATAGASSDDGIIGMTAKNGTGDPKITYKISDVDLLWGTLVSSTTKDLSDAAQPGVTGNESGTAGTHEKAVLNGETVAANLTKQQTDGKVYFAFKHVLSAVAGTDALKAQVVPSNGSLTDTKVSITSVSITDATANGNNQGELNLATGVFTGSGTGKVSSGDRTYNTADILADYATVTTPADWDAVKGLSDVNEHLILKESMKPILFMPGSTPTLTVNVQYTVWTKDTNLQDGWTKVPQNITKQVTFGSAVQRGKRYILLMKLGIEDVNFEATVDNWDDVDATGNQIINLPLNVE